MLEIANEIHYNIPAIPTAFLGITVCAIGTSFPNAVASVIMSQQNKPAAAIANALGSNVQNVFLAMAIPWLCFQTMPGVDCNSTEDPKPLAAFGAPLVQNAAGLTEGILWMIGTLILVIVFVLMPETCKLNTASGVILCLVYVFYLVLTSCETFMGFTLVKE